MEFYPINNLIAGSCRLIKGWVCVCILFKTGSVFSSDKVVWKSVMTGTAQLQPHENSHKWLNESLILLKMSLNRLINVTMDGGSSLSPSSLKTIYITWKQKYFFKDAQKTQKVFTLRASFLNSPLWKEVYTCAKQNKYSIKRITLDLSSIQLIVWLWYVLDKTSEAENLYF